MFPFMSKQSVMVHNRPKKRVRIVHPKPIKQRYMSYSDQDLSNRKGVARNSFLGDMDVVMLKEEYSTQVRRAHSCPDLKEMPMSWKNRGFKKSVYQRAQRQTEIYEAIARQKKSVPHVKASPPAIAGVSPPCGSVWGGTQLAIKGTSLGLDKSDIIGLYVCGSNCLSSLQYESQEIIYCRTKPWRACVGSVLVVTSSGGRSSPTAKFAFYQDEPPDEVNLPTITVTDVETMSECGQASDVHSDTISLREESDNGYSLDRVDTRRDCFRILNTVDDGTQTYESAADLGDRPGKHPMRRSHSGPLSEEYTMLQGTVPASSNPVQWRSQR